MAGPKKAPMTALSKFERSPKWTMRSRSTSSPGAMGGINKWTPAPGAYDNVPPEQVKYRHAPKFGFGTGNRFADLQKAAEKAPPGPGQYNPSDPIIAASRSIGFGTSQRPGISGAKGGSVRGPGPGTYEMHELVGRSGPMFTARGRKGFGQRSMSSPGPGSYSIGSLMELGPKAGFGTSTRDDENKRNSKRSGVPGPGSYEVGGYRTFGNEARKFSLTSRRQQYDLETLMSPGPGQYKSDITSFGY